jgi:ABC-2 type transport system ATP-binding protein
MLTIRNFQKSYPPNDPVLTIPALELGPGVHYFRGGNGAGKSTFLRSVAGLMPCTGEIRLDDLDISRDPVAYRLRVSYAEAEPLYPDFLTARDLSAFVGRARQAPPGQPNELANWLGMNDFRHKPTGTYSSGMLKKTALLLALLGRPEVLLLDEPFTTLDAETTARLIAYLRQQLTDGLTLLLTSHQDLTPTGLPLTATWRVANATITPEP